MVTLTSTTFSVVVDTSSVLTTDSASDWEIICDVLSSVDASSSDIVVVVVVMVCFRVNVGLKLIRDFVAVFDATSAVTSEFDDISVLKTEPPSTLVIFVVVCF